jgi:uncharacterized membrane protein YbhN (UPF0104 family)
LKKYLLKFLKLGIILLTGFYLYTAIYRDISQIKPDILQTSHLLIFGIAFFLFAIFFFIKTMNWFIILKQCGGHASFSVAAKIWFASQTIKYLPGKLWFIVARLYMGRGVVPAPLIFLSTLVELILMLLSATLMFFILGGYHFVRLIETQWMAIVTVTIVVPASLVVIHPLVLNKIVSNLRRFARSPIEPLAMRYRQILWLLIIYCLNWLLFGLANCLILYAISSSWPENLLRTTSIFPISYVIGFVSFLTPGGIGVRESIQVYLLGQLGWTSAIAAAVAIISRIFWMGCELVGALIFVGLKNLGRLRFMPADENK